MTIIVESTWNGRENGFRVTLPNGGREQFTAYKWTRTIASKVLDVLEHVYHLNRTSIRFDVR